MDYFIPWTLIGKMSLYEYLCRTHVTYYEKNIQEKIQ